MPAGSWLLQNNTLGLKADDDSGIISLTAKEIYSVEFGQLTEINGYTIKKPSQFFPDIHFSKYPLRLKICIISHKRSKQNEEYFCYIIGRKDSYESLINYPFTQISDQIITNNVWFPLIYEEIQEVVRIFKACNIQGTGILTLRQFFNLMKFSSPTIEIVLNPQISVSFPELDEGKSDTLEQIEGFTGKLYDYQLSGYKWLKMIDREDLGCILADEMGLGKTIQIICLILSDSGNNLEPVLIIAPATLLENWKREITRFAPKLRVLIHQGTDRTGFHSDFRKYDVIITSYDTILRDIIIFRMFTWNIVILDEAQAIKNPRAKRTEKVKSLPRRMGIAVTGTPVENRLLDLWSIFDFIIPGFLGTKDEFEKKFCDEDSAGRIEPFVSPIILRRKIVDVADDLPDKIIIPQALTLPSDLIAEYEKIRINVFSEYGSLGGLVSLQKLRMYCTHPYLISPNSENPAICSPKYQRFTEIVEEIIENHEKALVFTEFTDMIDIFYSDLPQRFPGIFIDFIDGRVAIIKRQPIVDNFNNFDGPGILILNPRAAGTGLNLTGANHVIHYTPVWNPAVEDQASARAYRRGQSLPVTIHRLFYVNTVEEVVNDRLESKREIFEDAVIGTSGDREDYEDIRKALEITPFRDGTHDTKL